MKKVLNILKFCSLFSISTSLFAIEKNATNDALDTTVYVQLNSNKAIAQKELKQLEGMDIVGFNKKTNQVEVHVTQSEFNNLKNSKLKLISKLQNNNLTVDLTGYLTPTQVHTELTKLNQKFPNITHLFEIGKTHSNFSIKALEVSSAPGNTKKPVVLFNAMLHAREVMSAEVAMHMAKVLTEQYGKDAEITEWVDNYRIIIVPQVNPEGNSFVHNGKNMWRKNGAKFHGVVTGVDLNRNFPAYWNYCNGSSGWESSQTFRGPSPASEPETKAMMNLVSTTKPVVSISYHSYSEMVIYPFGCSKVNNPSKDLFVNVAKQIRAGIRDDNNRLDTYSLGTAPELLYETDGGDDDWFWKDEGVVAFTIEVNASDFQPNYNKWRNVTVERQEGGWKNLIRQLQKSGFHGFVQTSNPNQITYSLEKLSQNTWLAFDADNSEKKFSLRSQDGLMYQLTEKGRYKINFYRNNEFLKSLTIDVQDKNIDLGNIEL